MESSIVIKVMHAEIVRRFSTRVVDGKFDLNMDRLREKIVGLFKFSPGTELRITYFDEDGDVITLADDEDLHDVARQSLNPLRITVTTGRSGESSSSSGASENFTQLAASSSSSWLLQRLQILNSEDPLRKLLTDGLTLVNKFYGHQSGPDTPALGVSSNETVSGNTRDPKINEAVSGNTRDPKINEAVIGNTRDPKSNEAVSGNTRDPMINMAVIGNTRDPKINEAGKSGVVGPAATANVLSDNQSEKVFQKGELKKMFLFFPDPHFMEKYHWRRVISIHLDEYAYALAVGGIIYTLTNMEELGEWMNICLESHPLFEPLSGEELENDPFGKFLSSAVCRKQVYKAFYRRISSQPH